MLQILSNFFQKEKIEYWAPIPLSACRIIRPYLLKQVGIDEGSVIMLCIPYFTRDCETSYKNISAYAVSRDYHLYFKDLFERLITELKARFPTHKFAAFADHSPIAEVETASRAGLGVIGKNRLLLTQKYSSYVFLGELITDAVLPSAPMDPQGCIGCGRCLTACPTGMQGICLSSLTQKKGDLTRDERDLLSAHPLIWGCDLCQEICPYTQKALQENTIFSPIPFFTTNAIPFLHARALAEMSDEAFAERAYSWRSRETVLRNLKLKEESKETEGGSEC